MPLIKPFCAAMTLTWKALLQRSKNTCLTFAWAWLLRYLEKITGTFRGISLNTPIGQKYSAQSI